MSVHSQVCHNPSGFVGSGRTWSVGAQEKNRLGHPGQDAVSQGAPLLQRDPLPRFQGAAKLRQALDVKPERLGALPMLFQDGLRQPAL
jgi:hypothetical protein